MKRPRRLAVFALCGALTAGLAPASLVTAALAERCAGQCRFAEVEGYWWRGAADLYLASGKREQGWYGLGRIAWGVEAGGLQLRIGQGTARLAVAGHGLQLSLDAVRIPAGSLLGQIGHGLPRDGWSGTLLARQASIELPWPFRSASGSGEVLWQHAQTSLLENYPLGDFQLAWTLAADGRWQARLQGRGALQIDGELQAPPFRLDGVAELDEHAGVLRKYLLMVGQPEGEQRYRIALPVTPGGN